MIKIYFKKEWLHAARTLEGNNCGILLEAIVAHQLYKRWPPETIDKEVMGAFKVVHAELAEAWYDELSPEDKEQLSGYRGGLGDGK